MPSTMYDIPCPNWRRALYRPGWTPAPDDLAMSPAQTGVLISPSSRDIICNVREWLLDQQFPATSYQIFRRYKRVSPRYQRFSRPPAFENIFQGWVFVIPAPLITVAFRLRW